MATLSYDYSVLTTLECEFSPDLQKTKVNSCTVGFFEDSPDESVQLFGSASSKNYLLAQTVALANGINALIQSGHQRGIFDSAEHLRFIINELEKQFVKVSTVEFMGEKVEPIEDPLFDEIKKVCENFSNEQLNNG